MPDHEFYMSRALELAKTALSLGEVPVGCVIVWEDGSIVGEGYNRRETDGDALGHAELMAIRQANQTLGGWRLHKAKLYVTLEPCPMCAGAIINARLKRVVYAAKDEKAGACGTVVNLFEMGFNHRPVLKSGVLAEEAAGLLSGFFGRLRDKGGARE